MKFRSSWIWGSGIFAGWGVGLGVFLLGFFAYGLPAAIYPFYTRGEAREGLVVQAMFESGNYILPLRNGSDIPSKPPGFHWLATLFSQMTSGPSELSLRLPSALAAAGLLVVFYFFSRRYLSQTAALLGCGILASSLDFFRYAGVARVDMVFSFWLGLATFSLFKIVEQSKANGKLSAERSLDSRGSELFYCAIASLALSFATLSKGPAGLVLPFIVSGSWALLSSRLKDIPFFKASVLLLIATALAAVWYYLAYLQGGDKFLSVHLMKENLARVTGDEDYDTGHKGSVFSLPALLFSALLPWSLYLPIVISALWRARKQLSSPAKFCLLWLALYLLLFSIPSSKRGVYLLPCLGAYAFILAYLADSHLRYSQWSKRTSLALFAALLPIFSLLFAFVVFPQTALILGAKLGLKARYLAQLADVISHPAPLIVLSSSALLFIALSCLRLAQGAVLKSLLFTFLFAASSELLAQLAIVPLVAEQQSAEPFAEQVKRAIGEAPLYQFDDDFYVFNYYFLRNIPKIKSPEEFSGVEGEKFLLYDSRKQAEVEEKFPGLKQLLKSERLDQNGSAPLAVGTFNDTVLNTVLKN